MYPEIDMLWEKKTQINIYVSDNQTNHILASAKFGLRVIQLDSWAKKIRKVPFP